MLFHFVGIVLSFYKLSVSVSDNDPCVVYRELQESSRSQFHSLSNIENSQCDNNLVPGWYRFKGEAGLKMPNSCVKSGHCGTHSPGWFDGSLPTDVGGNSSGRVCFNWMGSCCQWSVPSTVKHCNGFYVYQLSPTRACDLQYCGDGATESDPTTTAPPNVTATTKPEDDFALHVDCNKDEIKVVLHIKTHLNYDPESVHLNDASCKPYFQNSSHIFVKLTLEGCGMTWNVSKDGKMIIYRNAIAALVKSQGPTLGPFATRDHLAVFEFQCRYRRTAVLSVVSFNPSEMYVISDIESFGNFTFEMNIFKSGDFKEHFIEYPVGPINVGTDIFLQVLVRSNHSGVVVFVDECKATATPNYDDEMQYVFLEDGCPKDNNLRYNYTLSSIQRFTLSAFHFRNVKSEEIFLHCLVLACLRSDVSSHCAKGCPFERRKKRASEREVKRFLAVGPIIISSSKPNDPPASASSSPEEDTIVVGVVAGVLGFVAILLVAALVAIICKPRQRLNVTGANTILLVRSNEPGPS